MNASELRYASISDMLEEVGSPISLAELHGGLCGVFCAGGRDVGHDWLEDQIADCEGPADDIAALAGRLELLEARCWRALTGTSMEFEPLLPDDDEDLAPRVQALALWCHGFLGGLVVGGYELERGQRGESEELEEIVHDFAAISQAGADPEDLADPDRAEALFVELSEYVRVSAQIAFETLASRGADARGETLH